MKKISIMLLSCIMISAGVIASASEAPEEGSRSQSRLRSYLQRASQPWAAFSRRVRQYRGVLPQVPQQLPVVERQFVPPAYREIGFYRLSDPLVFESIHSGWRPQQPESAYR